MWQDSVTSRRLLKHSSKLRCRTVADSYNDRDMNATFTAVVKQRGEWWIGWIEEVPGVNAQERTKPELLKSLREALVEALEFNREEARRAAEGEYVEEPVTV
jgi:hypothetical protein